MEPSKRFNELVVWQKAHQFVLNVYSISAKFPKEEIYGLTSQFRRAAVSIAANIAEGYAKKGKPDKLRYFNIAQGSLEECRYYLLLTKDLNFTCDIKLEDLLEEVSRLLNSYSRSINASR
jgi:four helix bundle protein